MSLDKIKAKLEALKAAQNKKGSESSGKTNDLTWKPSPGKQIVRILPNKHTDPGYPFVELPIYYNFGKTWLLSPSFNDNPDPIIEYCNGLTSGKKLPLDEFKAASALQRKLLPATRYYVPVIVRNPDGVDEFKFWGFAKTIFMELLTIMDDPDYGDISDMKTGRDFTVEYIPAASEGEFAKTKILPKPNTSVATNDSDLIVKIEAMPDIVETFTIPTYEELSQHLKDYFSTANAKVPEKNGISSKVTGNHDAANEGFDVKNINIPSPAVDFEKEFEDLLNSKK